MAIFVTANNCGLSFFIYALSILRVTIDSQADCSLKNKVYVAFDFCLLHKLLTPLIVTHSLGRNPTIVLSKLPSYGG